MWFITLILLIFILGLIILVHEFGHFIMAKVNGVYIHEFSIGMGPIIHTHKGKDGIDYNIRALPIGGFVSMAGEVYEDDDTNKIPKEKFMCNKKWWQRLLILGAGVFNNFVLAIVILFVWGLIFGAQDVTPRISHVEEGSAAAIAGVKDNDIILAINNRKVFSWDQAQIRLYLKDKDGAYDFTVKHEDNSVETFNIKPQTIKVDDQEQTVYGIQIEQRVEKGFLNTIKFAFVKFYSLISSMWITVVNLFTGKISLSSLSGPVGIYQVVGQSLKVGASSLIYLIAFLSINVGLINILPIPAFDGGHILFLIIEKIKGSPINAKFENICHTVFFFLLIALMIYVTVFDIIRFG